MAFYFYKLLSRKINKEKLKVSGIFNKHKMVTFTNSEIVKSKSSDTLKL